MRLALLLLLQASSVLQQPDSLLTRRVDSVFAQWNHPNTPGCALGVDRAGTPLLRRVYGLANLETGTPWSIGTLSESGSVAKQFVAGAIVLLARDGAFTLDDDITRWIPEAKGFGKKITIRNLLSHTSGIPDRYTLHAVQGRPAGETDHTNAEVLDLVSRLRDLNFDPGDDYEYSNTGLIIAATLLERASGKSLQAFTQERLFKPLGMNDTRWREDHRTVVPGRASAYAGTLARGFTNDHPFTRVIGSGGLLTTVDDFLKWEAALQSGAGPWGAVRDSLEQGMRLNDGTQLTYGLGVGVGIQRGVRVISHTGSTGGYRAALYRFPEQQVSLALLCNLGSINPAAVAQRVAGGVLGPPFGAAEPEPAGIALSPAALAAVTGAYHSPRTEQVLVLSLQNGALQDSLGRIPLIPLSTTKFKYRGSQRTLTIVPGSPVKIRVEAPNARSVEYVAVPRPRQESLAAYAGDYRSPELDARFHLIVARDTLQLDRGWEAPVPLLPLYRDGFSAGDFGLVRFERDRQGRVTGMVLWDGRVRHLHFERAVSP